MLNDLKKLPTSIKAVLGGGAILILGLLYQGRQAAATSNNTVAEARAVRAELATLTGQMNGIAVSGQAGQTAAAEVAAFKTIADEKLKEMRADLDRIEGRVAELDTKISDLYASQETLRSQVLNAPRVSEGESAPSAASQITPESVVPNLGILQEAEGFKVELVSAKIQGEALTIRFRMTNLNEDGPLFIDTKSLLYDDLGNVYKVSAITIGNTSKNLHAGSHGVSAVLINGVTTESSMKFNKISSKATRISSFDLILDRDTQRENNRSTKLNFRDLPIIR